MIILSVLIGLEIVGVLLVRFGERAFGVMVGLTGGVLLITSLIFLPVFYYDIVSEIKEFQAVKQTIEIARENASNIEKAALQHKVIDANTWLASNQYWNGTLFDIWIPDEVMELKPLR